MNPAGLTFAFYCFAIPKSGATLVGDPMYEFPMSLCVSILRDQFCKHAAVDIGQAAIDTVVAVG